MAFLQCEFHSDVLGRACSMNVLIPQKAATQIGMNSSGSKEGAAYPVLYLLHGLSDNHTIWMRRTSIERYAADYPLVVVMPNGERGFYTDMKQGYRYWTMLSEELPQIVRNLFPVSRRREDTYAAGLSMGGYGALKLALRRPDLFEAAAALSPVTDVSEFLRDSPSDRQKELKMIFGTPEEAAAAGDDLFILAERTRATSCPCPRLYQVCGSEDGLFDQNLRFRDHLRRLEWPEYHFQEKPGTHNWEFWDCHIQTALKFLIGKIPPV